MKKKKLISIVTPCFNEEENILELSSRIKKIMEGLKSKYDYEHIFIDNHSNDNTVLKIKSIIKKDKNIKLIVNSRNFGHVRSPVYGLLQSNGDVGILIASDLQDPPELIPKLIKKWEDGFLNVFIVKTSSAENKIFYSIRKLFYSFISTISDIKLIKNATGAGLFDKKIINFLKQIDDPYPYFRGLICDIGFPISTVEFMQPKRKRGFTKNNFFTLYDMAILGITNHSRLPLRLITMFGFSFSILSLLLSFILVITKLLFWDLFTQGYIPILVTILFMSSIIMFFIGILGEYILSIHVHVKKKPLVYELERINFKK